MIGIVGGYGDVGRHAARALKAWGCGPLRVGGRRLDGPRRAVAVDLGGEALTVDTGDARSLARFATGCRVVVNCAGPSYRIGDAVALAALRAGADYVDPGGDDVLHSRLGEVGTGARAAIVSAGVMPGLTGLLPRWLAARDFDHVQQLTFWFGALDRFTPVAADDYLQGAVDGLSEPLAGWRDGVRRSAVLTRRMNTRVAFFPGEVAVLPYLNTEGERLADALSLRSGSWFSVIDGRHLPVAFDRVRTMSRADAVAAVCRATDLDTAGRSRYVRILCQLDGTADGRPRTRTVVLRGPGVSELTGLCAALCTVALVGGAVGPGRHYAAGVLDPAAAVTLLDDMQLGVSLDVHDAPVADLDLAEEGVL